MSRESNEFIPALFLSVFLSVFTDMKERDRTSYFMSVFFFMLNMVATLIDFQYRLTKSCRLKSKSEPIFCEK